MQHVPALMALRKDPYDATELNVPAGAVPLDYADVNINAADAALHLGWRLEKHSDFVAMETDFAFPEIYPWYHEVFALQQGIPLGVA